MAGNRICCVFYFLRHHFSLKRSFYLFQFAFSFKSFHSIFRTVINDFTRSQEKRRPKSNFRKSQRTGREKEEKLCVMFGKVIFKMDTEKKKYSQFYFDIRLNWIFSHWMWKCDLNGSEEKRRKIIESTDRKPCIEKGKEMKESEKERVSESR